MPVRSKRICSYVGCQTIVQGKTRCEKHTKKSWEIKREYDPFYSSSKWKRLSKRFRQANPLCIQCQKEGKTKLGDHADHIIPITQGGDPLDWNNLQHLCRHHHSSKTAKEIRNK